MHIPMPNAEIATVLKVKKSDVDELVERGSLLRTIACPYRSVVELSWSSVYDVLEFLLANGDLPIVLTRKQASVWVYALSEADEESNFSLLTLSEQAFRLRSIVEYNGFSEKSPQDLKIADLVLGSRAKLVSLCIRNTNSAEW